MYFRCNLYEEIFMARSLGKHGVCGSGTGFYVIIISSGYNLDLFCCK